MDKLSGPSTPVPATINVVSVRETPRFAEIAGWYGMLAILLAFALSSFSVLEATSLPYQLINASGAIGLMLIAYYKGVMQNVILNAVWLAVAAITIITSL
jgi:ABC-type multidrug transport system permease subunit